MISAKSKLAFGIAIAAIFVMQGVRGYETLKRAAAEQDRITDGLERWNQSYRALRESRLKWDRDYRPIDSIPTYTSILKLIALDRYGLATDPDRFIVLKDSVPVTQNGVDLGLLKVCVGSGSGDGGDLVVQAPDYQSLLAGIQELAKRPDISIGNVTVQGDKGAPTGRLGEFCVLVRRG